MLAKKRKVFRIFTRKMSKVIYLTSKITKNQSAKVSLWLTLHRYPETYYWLVLNAFVHLNFATLTGLKDAVGLEQIKALKGNQQMKHKTTQIKIETPKTFAGAMLGFGSLFVLCGYGIETLTANPTLVNIGLGLIAVSVFVWGVDLVYRKRKH
jgi:hypothetical protein